MHTTFVTSLLLVSILNTLAAGFPSPLSFFQRRQIVSGTLGYPTCASPLDVTVTAATNLAKQILASGPNNECTLPRDDQGGNDVDAQGGCSTWVGPKGGNFEVILRAETAGLASHGVLASNVNAAVTSIIKTCTVSGMTGGWVAVGDSGLYISLQQGSTA